MIPKELETFRAARRLTLSALRQLDEHQADWAPPGRWSASEIFDHLLASERMWRSTAARLIALAKAGRVPLIVQEPEAMKTPLGTVPKQAVGMMTVPMAMMNMMIPGGVKEFFLKNRVTPLEAPASIRPVKGKSLAELEDLLEESFRETATLFATNDGADFKRMATIHPLLGRVDVPGMLRLLAGHEQRHLSQLAELKASPGFPQRTRPASSSTFDANVSSTAAPNGPVSGR